MRSRHGGCYARATPVSTPDPMPHEPTLTAADKTAILNAFDNVLTEVSEKLVEGHGEIADAVAALNLASGQLGSLWLDMPEWDALRSARVKNTVDEFITGVQKQLTEAATRLHAGITVAGVLQSLQNERDRIDALETSG